MDKRSLLRGEDEDNELAAFEDGMGPEMDEIAPKESCNQGRRCLRIITRSWPLASLTLNLGLLMLVLVQAGLHTSTSPIFKGPTITTHFEARTEYMSLDHAYDIYWEELLINKSHWPALAFGVDHDQWLGRATITMIHQIHCLQNLREALQQASEGKNIGVDWRDNKHWPHCFDTLLQSIVCYADDTIERPDIIDGVVGHAISGYNVERQCRDASPVYRLFETKGIIWPPEGYSTEGHHG